MTSSGAIRIGIIGAGFARTTQIPGFKAIKGARVVAIASARREHAEEVAREFDIPHVESDWRELIARDDVDLVSIVTPVGTHCEMTLAALERGKAVLCEKPMAIDADEAKRMTERAREAGVLALIDHELRFLSGRVKLRELLAEGEIGNVRHAKLTFRSDSRADTNRPWNWWSDKKQGGGTLGAIGSHVIDCFFFNETATTEIYTLSLHDALPIWRGGWGITWRPCGGRGCRWRRCWSSRQDRKSTRLNSSHVEISYAVFCLKK